MDERYIELIDKYLRKEMSPVESLNFEQEALNNPELRKEVELTYRIKKSLTDRQQKLHKTAQWGSKKKYRIVRYATISSIAAMLVLGIFLTKPVIDNRSNGNLIASATTESPEVLKEKSGEAIVSVQRSISEGKEKVAIAEVTKLEEQNVIPTLNEVSGGRYIMSHTLESEDVDILSKDAYELHWLKIQSLITIGKKAEAIELLKSFVTIEGKYKSTADSLLNSLK
ncbi:MAG: hypothetical protein IIW93_09205 [Bacteroidaceae bacterium]|nr:hypothetical protein [Bacteroidaceae bacterium]